MRRWLVAVALLALTGCELGDQDNAGSVAGPGVDIHCAALEPRGVGSTTTVVRCPGSTP
jgi:hypothetical protein